MNWYQEIKSAFVKIAFPYAAVQCSSCSRDMLADLGKVEQGLRSSNTSTDDPNSHPFRDMEKTVYDEPQTEFDPQSGEDMKRTQDTKENGTVIVQCPYCKAWSLANFSQDSSKHNPFDLYGFDFLENEPIDETLVQGYVNSGVPVVFTEKMDDSMKPEEKQDKLPQEQFVGYASK